MSCHMMDVLRCVVSYGTLSINFGVNLSIRNSSPNNATCQMTPKTVL